MIRALKIFLIITATYSIRATWMVFGVGPQVAQWVPTLIRESLRGVLILVGLIRGYRMIKTYLKLWKKECIVLGVLMLMSIALSLIYHKTAYDIIVGVKYTLWPLVILLTATRIGHILPSQRQQAWLRRVIRLIWVVIIGGLIRQGAKHLIPEVFVHRGYGPVGDRARGTNPPLYYRTGPGGWPRLSGLLAGPNNYGYLLVAYGMLLLHTINHRRRVGGWISYIASLILTMSRGAIIGLGAQMLVWYRQYYKTHKWIIIGGGMVGVGLLAWLFGDKAGSTMAHIQAKGEGVVFALHNITGLGLGTAGPAIHHTGTILPENYYLQIVIETGIQGLLLRIVWWSLIWHKGRTILTSQHLTEQEKTYARLMLLGVRGLMIEGMFLHVWEDSTVNYLFLVPLGMLLGVLVRKHTNQTISQQQTRREIDTVNSKEA